MHHRLGPDAQEQGAGQADVERRPQSVEEAFKA